MKGDVKLPGPTVGGGLRDLLPAGLVAEAIRDVFPREVIGEAFRESLSLIISPFVGFWRTACGMMWRQPLRHDCAPAKRLPGA
jgi:hypothetical protein